MFAFKLILRSDSREVYETIYCLTGSTDYPVSRHTSKIFKILLRLTKTSATLANIKWFFFSLSETNSLGEIDKQKVSDLVLVEKTHKYCKEDEEEKFEYYIGSFLPYLCA